MSNVTSHFWLVLILAFSKAKKSRVNVIGGRQVTTCARAHMEAMGKKSD